MSWVIALLGICALVILHELGHMLAAKAVGMRVERFSLFFPPTIARIKRGGSISTSPGAVCRHLFHSVHIVAVPAANRTSSTKNRPLTYGQSY